MDEDTEGRKDEPIGKISQIAIVIMMLGLIAAALYFIIINFINIG